MLSIKKGGFAILREISANSAISDSSLSQKAFFAENAEKGPRRALRT